MPNTLFKIVTSLSCSFLEISFGKMLLWVQNNSCDSSFEWRFARALTLLPLQLCFGSAQSIPINPCAPWHWKEPPPSWEKRWILSSCCFGSFQTISCAFRHPSGHPTHTPASRCVSLCTASFLKLLPFWTGAIREVNFKGWQRLFWLRTQLH